MIDLPSDFFIESTLEIGTVYKFEAPELIKTDVPHYFIIVAMEDEENYMVLCSSRKESRLNYINRMGYNLATLVYIKPDSGNGFSVDTYVDCNEYFTISKVTLINKHRVGILEHKGSISLNHYLQIKKGIIESYVNDLPADMLQHPDE